MGEGRPGFSVRLRDVQRCRVDPGVCLGGGRRPREEADQEPASVGFTIQSHARRVTVPT